MKLLQILTSSGSIFSIIAIKWIIGSQYNFITGEKYCYFTSLKWFLELLQSHFAYILSVNVSEIHKNRPVSQNTWNGVYVQPETFYILQYVLFILQRVLIVPYTTQIGNTELFPSAFTAMSFTNDIVSGILFFKHVFQPRHGVSVELQQNLWKFGTKLYWEMLSPPAL